MRSQNAWPTTFSIASPTDPAAPGLALRACDRKLACPFVFVLLDEMSPSDFGKAWDKRNERLRDGGLFEYVTDLTDAHGWEALEKMTASELIRAVADLGLTPSAADPELAGARK
jgi:hypothetical protein